VTKQSWKGNKIAAPFSGRVRNDGACTAQVQKIDLPFRVRVKFAIWRILKSFSRLWH